MRELITWLTAGVVLGLMAVILGAMLSGCAPPDLGSECARICGDDWFKCSISRPDEPRGARITQLATDTSPGIDFSIRYSGVICEFVYVNHAVSALNFNIGVAVAPETERGQNRRDQDDPEEANE